MPSTTGTAIVNGAFSILGVFAAGETPPSADSAFALTFLNDLLSEWSQRTAFIPVIGRERFSLVANQGSPSTPYTIGPGGDFDTERPSNQGSITAANLILTASSPEVHIPLGIYTDDAYDANRIPDQTSVQPTGLYYNPTYTTDLGSICLWPVPNTATNDLELFLEKGVAQFANLTTTYYVPDGLPRALKYNLGDALGAPYGRELSPSAKRIATSSLNTFMRSNVKLSDQTNDARFGSHGRGVYNILSDTITGGR